MLTILCKHALKSLLAILSVTEDILDDGQPDLIDFLTYLPHHIPKLSDLHFLFLNELLKLFGLDLARPVEEALVVVELIQGHLVEICYFGAPVHDLDLALVES